MAQIVSVVTGANSGIGRATALHLAAHGHRVFATMRSLDRGAKLEALAAEQGVDVTPVVLDVADDESVARGFGEILDDAGRVDVVVNNAGIGQNAALGDVDLDAAKALFDVNLWGIVRCSQQVLPGMVERGSGHLVQVSSIAGRVGLPGQPVYTASKWAVEGLCENLAHDLAPLGVRVSVIEPGVTRTAILGKNADFPESSIHADVYGRMFDMYASGIVANVRPEVVAETILEAIDAEPGRLRWPVAWGADEMGGGRPCTDAEWAGLGELAPDGAAWRERFGALFGLTVIPADPAGG